MKHAFLLPDSSFNLPLIDKNIFLIGSDQLKRRPASSKKIYWNDPVVPHGARARYADSGASESGQGVHINPIQDDDPVQLSID